MTVNACGEPCYPFHSDDLYSVTGVNPVDKEYDVGPNYVFATFQTINPVPVPGSVLMLSAGLLSLAGILRRPARGRK